MPSGEAAGWGAEVFQDVSGRPPLDDNRVHARRGAVRVHARCSARDIERGLHTTWSAEQPPGIAVLRRCDPSSSTVVTSDSTPSRDARGRRLSSELHHRDGVVDRVTDRLPVPPLPGAKRQGERNTSVRSAKR